MLILLEINDYVIEYRQEELINIIMELASSEKSESDLLTWVRVHLL